VPEKPDKLPTVREHAEQLVNAMVDKGHITPDPDAAIAARGIPTFSKGTATLDPNTGRPVAQSGAELPEFENGTVTAPEQDGGPPPASAPGAEQEAQRILAEHQARVAEARTREQAAGAPAGAEGSAPPPAAPPGAAEGAAAAEAAAAAQIEFEEFEFEDPDLNLKYPVRVPKHVLETAKRGYGRRAAYDRAIRYAKDADPVLRPLIEDGRLARILPLLQRALEDPAYGEYVYQGYERATKGLPLIEQARAEASAAATLPAPSPAAGFSADLNALAAEDPYFAERAAPILKTVEDMQQKLARIEQERTTQAQRAVEEQRLNQQRGAEMASAHRDLAAAYPSLYTGDLQRDDAIWRSTVKYASDSGYANAYGLRAAIVFAGQQIAAMEQERLAATASPAATALAAQESQHLELARRQAAAASRTVGAGAATAAAPPPPPQRPSTRNADGTLKKPEQFIQENIRYLQQTRA
jgi:hypothetical protein